MAESHDAIGSVAEEAMKLLYALSTNGGVQEHRCTNAWCPLCQMVNYVRDNPEAIERVTQSAATLARSVRELIEQAVPAKEPAAPEETAPHEEGT
ncbi:MAG: hypothetical protein H7288_18305 [Kineosporiaceae bacterium]|nr:hypothetical protein [Aeromicrobium sp.]